MATPLEPGRRAGGVGMALATVQRSEQGTMCMGEEEDKMAVGPTQIKRGKTGVSGQASHQRYT